MKLFPFWKHSGFFDPYSSKLATGFRPSCHDTPMERPCYLAVSQMLLTASSFYNDKKLGRDYLLACQLHYLFHEHQNFTKVCWVRLLHCLQEFTWTKRGKVFRYCPLLKFRRKRYFPKLLCARSSSAISKGQNTLSGFVAGLCKFAKKPEGLYSISKSWRTEEFHFPFTTVCTKAWAFIGSSQIHWLLAHVLVSISMKCYNNEQGLYVICAILFVSHRLVAVCLPDYLFHHKSTFASFWLWPWTTWKNFPQMLKTGNEILQKPSENTQTETSLQHQRSSFS